MLIGFLLFALTGSYLRHCLHSGEFQVFAIYIFAILFAFFARIVIILEVLTDNSALGSINIDRVVEKWQPQTYYYHYFETFFFINLKSTVSSSWCLPLLTEQFCRVHSTSLVFAFFNIRQQLTLELSTILHHLYFWVYIGDFCLLFSLLVEHTLEVVVDAAQIDFILFFRSSWKKLCVCRAQHTREIPSCQLWKLHRRWIFSILLYFNRCDCANIVKSVKSLA